MLICIRSCVNSQSQWFLKLYLHKGRRKVALGMFLCLPLSCLSCKAPTPSGIAAVASAVSVAVSLPRAGLGEIPYPEPCHGSVGACRKLRGGFQG